MSLKTSHIHHFLYFIHLRTQSCLRWLEEASARSGLQMHPNCRLLPAYFPVNNTERAEHKQQQPVPEYTLLTQSRALTQSAWFAI